MTLQEYHLQTRRTLPDLDNKYGINDPGYQLITNSPLKENQLETIHMLLGMTSELYELDEAVTKGDIVNIAEELIDILWYTSNYAYLREIDISGYQFPSGGVSYEIDIAFNISKLVDPNKKFFAYGRIIQDQIRVKEIETYFELLDAIGQFATLYSIDMERAMQNNIDKLKNRFPYKFDAIAALDENRNLDAERRELEK